MMRIAANERNRLLLQGWLGQSSCIADPSCGCFGARPSRLSTLPASQTAGLASRPVNAV